jgi:hypothetical protein
MKEDKMWKRILTVSLVLAIILSLVACVKEEEELASAQEIIDGVIESLDDIRTCQFDIDMTMHMAGEAEGEMFEGTMVTDSSGAFDLENRQMRMDMTMSLAMIGEDEMEMGTEMYLIGDMMYMLMEIPEMEPMWMKSEVPEGYWEEMNQIESQIELLEAAQVEVIGSEMVGGIDCYVLQLTPDLERLWQIVAQQAQVTGEAAALTEESLQEMFQSFSVKQWIAKDTYFLTKTEADMAVELTPEAMGFPGEEGLLTMDITMNLLAYNYNQPVSIVLPPEAEQAIEVPMF